MEMNRQGLNKLSPEFHGQAWVCESAVGVAVFKFPPLCKRWYLSGGLGQ